MQLGIGYRQIPAQLALQMNSTVDRSTRWCSLICQFIVSSLSSALSILMSYQVLIEWVNTRPEKWLCSNFSDHCGNIKFPRCDRNTAFCLRYFIVFMAEVTKQAATVPKTADGCSFSLLYFRSHTFFFLFSSHPHNSCQDNFLNINSKSTITYVFTFPKGRSMCEVE